MTSPINIKPDGSQPSPILLPRNFSFSSSTSSTTHTPVTFSKLPERPSFITNKMSPHNAIPIDPNEPEPQLILHQSLKSVRHSSLSRPTSANPTPALSTSSSKTNSCNATPLMSPATTHKVGEGVVSPETLAADLEVVAETKRLLDKLNDADKYLVFLRDNCGVTDWKEIEDSMNGSGYPGRKEEFRVRYFVVKRDVDAKLKFAISNYRSTQAEVDFYLENGILRDRHAQMAKKKSSVRSFSDDETQQINTLTATLRASGL